MNLFIRVNTGGYRGEWLFELFGMKEKTGTAKNHQFWV
jgi:hypothetical protein